MAPTGLFVPGFAVRGTLYAPILPEGWIALDPPSPAVTKGRFAAHRVWLLRELEARERCLSLAGHSMGASLAICAAAGRPDLVDRLILFSPAGLPLSKPMRESFLLVVAQMLQGLYPPREIGHVVADSISHPRATLRLAREAHDLDLSDEFAAVAASATATRVVGCSSDTLTTPAICRSIAAGLGADYREVDGKGHMWMLTDRSTFASMFADHDRR